MHTHAIHPYTCTHMCMHVDTNVHAHTYTHTHIHMLIATSSHARVFPFSKECSMLNQSEICITHIFFFLTPPESISHQVLFNPLASHCIYFLSLLHLSLLYTPTLVIFALATLTSESDYGQQCPKISPSLQAYALLIHSLFWPGWSFQNSNIFMSLISDSSHCPWANFQTRLNPRFSLSCELPILIILIPHCTVSPYWIMFQGWMHHAVSPLGLCTFCYLCLNHSFLSHLYLFFVGKFLFLPV